MSKRLFWFTIGTFLLMLIAGFLYHEIWGILALGSFVIAATLAIAWAEDKFEQWSQKRKNWK